MIKLDISSFKFPELFNDSYGKTDANKLIGFIGCLAAIFAFIICGNLLVYCVWKDKVVPPELSTLLMQAVAFFTIAGSMLAIDRVTKDKEVKNTIVTDDTKNEG